MKSILMSILLSFLSAVVYIGITILLFEINRFRLSYKEDLILEVFVQLLILLIGLLFYYRIEKLKIIEELKNGLLITVLYSLSMGQFHQMIYPTSEPPSYFESLILNFEHNWVIIVFGITIIYIRYTNQRLKNTPH